MDLTASKKTDDSSRRNEGLEFVVMPKFDKGSSEPAKPTRVSPPGTKRKKMAVAISLLIIAALAAFGYFIYQKWGKSNETKNFAPDDQGTKIDIPDQAKADADADGLNSQVEAERGTATDKPDTDGDGLSDGDEVNVYGSDPLRSDTDSDTYNDGDEVAGGYSPIVSATIKANAAERQKWLQKSVEFGLHEPTITTLKSKPTSDEALRESRTLYTNQAYNYSIEYPSALALRDEDSGRQVGLYIAGAEPQEKISEETFTIALEGTVESQNLKDWVTSVYERYQALEEMTINGFAAVRLKGMTSDEYACARDKTFFMKDGKVITVTWNCSEAVVLEPYYTELINSFKFR